MELVIGCDFGAPLPAGAQSKKTIALEAVRTGERSYAIVATGRNERLVRGFEGSRKWTDRRRGWTAEGLALSLAPDPNVTVVALDFPFSIPLGLLQDQAFAERAGADVFVTREHWRTFVAARVDLSFSSDASTARMRMDPSLQGWRHKAFWTKRATDRATNAQPPLKDKFQNLFNMTLIGSSFLGVLSAGGMRIALQPEARKRAMKRVAVETYPGAVARAIGFSSSYKREPRLCLEAAQDYLKARNIVLQFDPAVRRFCLDYRTSQCDPDGADAFLCLVTAICCREGAAEWRHGDALVEQLREEGCIVVPARLVVAGCSS